jgi:RNA polymerase sigma-70 factor, ECF subfamily
MDREQGEDIEQMLRQEMGRGDFQALAARIVESYGDELFGYLVRTMRDERDAAEVFSQFCEDLCRGLPGFQGRSTFRTWTYKLATSARARHYLDPYRRRGVRLETDEVSKIEQEVRSRTLAFLRTEARDGFARIREQLDPEEQSLLTLRVDRDMGWTEIAEVMTGPGEATTEQELASRAATMRQRFKRLKDKIRKLGREQGLMESM